MKIIHYSDAESKFFDNDVAKGVTGRVLIGQADGANNFCMRIFELAENGHTPRHSHEWEHEIFIHSGKGEAFCEDKWTPVEAGCALFIPGNVEHQIRNTSSAPLIFVCLIPSGASEI